MDKKETRFSLRVNTYEDIIYFLPTIFYDVNDINEYDDRRFFPDNVTINKVHEISIVWFKFELSLIWAKYIING